jgi:hypothetical protein
MTVTLVMQDKKRLITVISAFAGMTVAGQVEWLYRFDRQQPIAHFP